MTLRHLTIDRISLSMEGLPVDQAQFVAARLEAALSGAFGAALAAQAGNTVRGTAAAPLETGLTGPALVQAVAARLVDLVGLQLPRTSPEDEETATGNDASEEPATPGPSAPAEFMPWP